METVKTTLDHQAMTELRRIRQAQERIADALEGISQHLGAGSILYAPNDCDVYVCNSEEVTE